MVRTGRGTTTVEVHRAPSGSSETLRPPRSLCAKPLRNPRVVRRRRFPVSVGLVARGSLPGVACVDCHHPTRWPPKRRAGRRPWKGNCGDLSSPRGHPGRATRATTLRIPTHQQVAATYQAGSPYRTCSVNRFTQVERQCETADLVPRLPEKSRGQPRRPEKFGISALINRRLKVLSQRAEPIGRLCGPLKVSFKVERRHDSLPLTGSQDPRELRRASWNASTSWFLWQHRLRKCEAM